jgi:hypothetical protein
MSIIQQVAGASSTNSPASFPITLASTQVGSTLYALVAFAPSAANQTITTPANWTLLASLLTQTGIGYAVYSYPANPGSLTTITFAGLSNLFSIAGVIYEIPVGQTYPGALPLGVSQSSTAVTTPVTIPLLTLLQYLGAVFYTSVATTYTDASPNAWTIAAATTSTSGTTNISVRPATVAYAYALPPAVQLAGILNVAAPNMAIYSGFLAPTGTGSLNSGTLSTQDENLWVTGRVGQFPAGYSGAVGG